MVYRTNIMSIGVDLQDRICVVETDSAEGKSILFELMKTMPEYEDRLYVYDWSNYKTIREDSPIFYDDNSVVIFDDADLYLAGKDLFVKSIKCTAIIVTKNLYRLCRIREYGLYDVVGSRNIIEIKRRV